MYTPAKNRNSGDDEISELEHLRKLFIGGLDPRTTEESLESFYEQWGNVVDCVVMRDAATKKSRGFGFITYTKASMVDDAQNARPHVIDGKTVDSKRALLRPERENRETKVTVKKLFVGGLKDNHDEGCLREHFSQFGNVVGVKIISDRTTGRRRGFAYVEFDDYDAVDKALLQKSHLIKYVPVDVKKSVYKQELEKRTANGQAPSQNPPTNGQPMNGPPQPPANYNNWGPPNNYNGYNQPPANNWNWNQPPQNGWNGPPQPQWNQNNYGPPPQANWNSGPTPPQANWNSGPAPPQPNWNNGPAPPQSNWNSGPAPQQSNWNSGPAPPPSNWNVGGPQAQGPPQTQGPPDNLGNGYQQNYGGGPQKTNLNTNRKNPYNSPIGDSQQQSVNSNRRY